MEPKVKFQWKSVLARLIIIPIAFAIARATFTAPADADSILTIVIIFSIAHGFIDSIDPYLEIK